MRLFVVLVVLYITAAVVVVRAARPTAIPRNMPHDHPLRSPVRQNYIRSRPMEHWAECTYRDVHHHRQKLNFTRADVWTCLEILGDTNHDHVLTESEISKAIDTHLTTLEAWGVWSAQNVIDQCYEQSGQKTLPQQVFMNANKRDCMGNKKDICRAFGLCRRELGTEDGRPAP